MIFFVFKRAIQIAIDTIICRMLENRCIYQHFRLGSIAPCTRWDRTWIKSSTQSWGNSSSPLQDLSTVSQLSSCFMTPKYDTCSNHSTEDPPDRSEYDFPNSSPFKHSCRALGHMGYYPRLCSISSPVLRSVPQSTNLCRQIPLYQ